QQGSARARQRHPLHRRSTLAALRSGSSAWSLISYLGSFPEDRLNFVLKPTRLDGTVHSALLGRAVLPPPPAAACVLAGLDRSGAGGASDARVTLIVESVV